MAITDFSTSCSLLLSFIMSPTSLFFTVLLFTTQILAHELGHFAAGKLLNAKIERLSIGFGRVVFKKQWGETEYTICMIGLGGYTKFYGEDPNGPEPPPDDKRAFPNLAIWKRVVIVMMGSIMNILFGVVVVWALFVKGFYVKDNVIGTVELNSPAYHAGIKEGDKISAINGKPITNWDQAGKALYSLKGGSVVVAVDRNGKEAIFQVTPAMKEIRDIVNRKITVAYLGIRPSGHMVPVREGIFSGLKRSVIKIYEIAELVCAAFVQIARGDISLQQLSGPLGVVGAVHTALQVSYQNYFVVLALISVNIGIFNLIPFPPLDGGYLIYLAIEKIRGRRLDPKIVLNIQRVGITAVLALFFFTFYNDLEKLGLFKEVKNIDWSFLKTSFISIFK